MLGLEVPLQDLSGSQDGRWGAEWLSGPSGPLLGQLHLVEPERFTSPEPRGGPLSGTGNGANFQGTEFFLVPSILETE